jgi:SAM-dependent methyltransferase
VTGAVRTWIDFWNSAHAIYVNDRHKRLHAEAVAADMLRHIPSPVAIVLDHGCGEALYAPAVARHCGRLILCEAAPAVRAELAQRVAGMANVAVVAPGAVQRLEDGSLDLVVANSLVQYLTASELEALLDLWQRKLRRHGILVIADVIPPGVTAVEDAAALLRFAWRGGFLRAALAGLARAALSEYGKLRVELGLATYAEPEFLALLARHGFTAERIHPNFGHNQARMAFRAVPA